MIDPTYFWDACLLRPSQLFRQDISTVLARRIRFDQALRIRFHRACHVRFGRARPVKLDRARPMFDMTVLVVFNSTALTMLDSQLMVLHWEWLEREPAAASVYSGYVKPGLLRFD